MKNNLTLTITDKIEVCTYNVMIAGDSIHEMIAEALGVREDEPCRQFVGKVTIKIDDLSEPLRIERPEDPAESEASHA